MGAGSKHREGGMRNNCILVRCQRFTYKTFSEVKFIQKNINLKSLIFYLSKVCTSSSCHEREIIYVEETFIVRITNLQGRQAALR
jgi:hypothetical protein